MKNLILLTSVFVFLVSCNQLQDSKEVQQAMGNQCAQLNILYNKNASKKLLGVSLYLDSIRNGNELNCQNAIAILNSDIQGKCVKLAQGNISCDNQ